MGRPQQRTGRLARPGRLAAALCLAAGIFIPTSVAHAAEVYPITSTGVWTVDGHGNGHGHGMSQYGARGAAIAGLSYDRILAFYYPGTALSAAPAVPIRVQLSGAGVYATVGSKAGLTLTGISGALPTAGIDMWRLVPIAGGFQVQRHTSTGWHAYTNLPAAKLDFRAGDGTIKVFGSWGSRTYRGAVSGVASGSSAIVVNALSLDDYVRGVVPSEMPASWQAPAVQAQAVAARTYGRYYVEHPRSTAYDICDTTACQVYGGLSAEQTGSNDAVTRTSNRILTYGGATAFAEFSASNGGMTSSGNQPYFVTKVDPYDNAASGDPYLNWTKSVAASSVASYYGLDSVRQIQITSREGGGTWGGLVSSGIVSGLRNGAATSISVGGADLARAMGLSYRYFKIRPVAPVGHLDSTRMTSLHTMQVQGWAMDLANGGASTTINIAVDASAHSYTANLPRPDVQRAYHSGSPNHGFSVALSIPDGTHTVCVTAVNLNATASSPLGCTRVSVPFNPMGRVESLARGAAGQYRLAGWTFDPDVNGGPSRVHVYVDQRGYSLPAANPRPDVQRYFRLANDQVGFAVAVPVPAGSHRLCAYGINHAGTPGANQTLQCWTVAG